MDPAQAPPQVVALSAAMREVVETATRIARSDVSVLLLGESGTGKEVIAQTIHAHSRRATRPFVRYNCAALPASLAEAELFGHARGAFTGAYKDRPGIFAEANGGTLLLDEIGELPMEVQAKLLRILQNGEVQVLGRRSTPTPIRVDTRIICATNRDIEHAVAEGTFRADLLYRLSVVVLRLPPLRDRVEEIEGLATHFATTCGRKYGLGEVRLTRGLLDRLREQPWPGNVRELENAIARMVVLSMHGLLDLSDWERAEATALRGPDRSDRSDRHERLEPAAALPAPIPPRSGADLTLREQIEHVEAEILAEALTRYGGNQSKTALSLNISRVTLAAKIRKYHLTASSEESPTPMGEARSARSGRQEDSKPHGPQPTSAPARGHRLEPHAAGPVGAAKGSMEENE